MVRMLTSACMQHGLHARSRRGHTATMHLHQGPPACSVWTTAAPLSTSRGCASSGGTPPRTPASGCPRRRQSTLRRQHDHIKPLPMLDGVQHSVVSAYSAATLMTGAQAAAPSVNMPRPGTAKDSTQARRRPIAVCGCCLKAALLGFRASISSSIAIMRSSPPSCRASDSRHEGAIHQDAGVLQYLAKAHGDSQPDASVPHRCRARWT
jgi:hypothetical protein